LADATFQLAGTVIDTPLEACTTLVGNRPPPHVPSAATVPEAVGEAEALPEGDELGEDDALEDVVGLVDGDALEEELDP